MIDGNGVRVENLIEHRSQRTAVPLDELGIDAGIERTSLPDIVSLELPARDACAGHLIRVTDQGDI